MLCWNFEFLIKFQLKTIKYSANLKVIWHILLYKCLHFFILYMQYFSGRKFMIQHNIYFYYKSLEVMPHFTVGNHQKKKIFWDATKVVFKYAPLPLFNLVTLLYIFGGPVRSLPPHPVLFFFIVFIFFLEFLEWMKQTVEYLLMFL